MENSVESKNKIILYVAFAIALSSMLGSLFFSEILKLPPCELCWYGRIALYPIVILLAVGIINKDKKIYSYVLPLSIAGLTITTFHNLLYYNIIPEGFAPCTLGVSCTAKLVALLGFIDIPLLAFLAFLTITVLMFIYKNNIKKEIQNPVRSSTNGQAL